MLARGLRTVSYVAARLPLPVVYTLATFIADWVFPLIRHKRRNALDNMAQVLGPDASPELVRRTVRAAVRNYARYLVDFLRAPYLTEEELARRIRVTDWSVLDRALEGGRGVIFVGMHMGSWDMGAACLARRGYAVHAVVDTFKHPHLNEYIQSTRRRSGLQVIPVSQASRRVTRVLRRGEILGLLIDRPLEGDGVPVQFFGRTAYLPGGAAALALRTGAPVLVSAVLRRPDHSFEGIISPAMTFEPSGDTQRDIQALTQRIVLDFEEIIRRHPDQWYMFRRMWQSKAHAAPTWDPIAAPVEVQELPDRFLP